MMSIFPFNLELSPDKTAFDKIKLRLTEWSTNNDKYGLLYINERLYNLIKWTIIPLVSFLMTQFYPVLVSRGGVGYYAMVVTWTHFVSLLFVRTRPEPYLRKDKKPREMKISDIVQINHDTYIYEMLLDHNNQELGFPTLFHHTIHVPVDELPEPVKEGEWNGVEDECLKGGHIIRKYTPLTHDKAVGKLIFFVKHYEKCDEFSDGGRFGRWIKEKKVGDTLSVGGPVGKYEYLPGGGLKSHIKKTTNWNIKQINFIAGGSGIAPAIQLMNAICYDVLPNDIEFNLIFANKTPDDLIFESILDDFKSTFPERIRIHYTVDKVSDSEAKEWTNSVGHITQDMFEKYLAPPGESTFFYFCGPLPMRKLALKFAEGMGQSRELIWGI